MYRIKSIKFFNYGYFFICVLICQPLAVESNEEPQNLTALKSEIALKSIHANYQVKASFFALPITAKITVEKIAPEIYQASIKLNSPFFKVDQKETARIQQCQVELQHITSQGSRMGSEDWNENITITWPKKQVTYQNGEKKAYSYYAHYAPTGFTSLFAHQFASLARQTQQKHKVLTYTQSSSGWRMDYINRGRAEAIKSKFYDEPVHADKFVIPRDDVDQEDFPSIWYKPETLGAFPLKMAMKLGVFRIETNLKKIDTNSEDLNAFFKEWGCEVSSKE